MLAQEFHSWAACFARTVGQKTISVLSPNARAFLLEVPPGLRVICKSGLIIHHGQTWYL